MVTSALLSLGGAVVSGIASNKAANSQSAIAREQIALAREQLELNKGLYEDQTGRLGRIRDANMATARNVFADNRANELATQRRLLGVTNNTADRSTRIANSAFDRETRVARNARDESLAGFQPYADTGRNALASIAYEMGLAGELPNGVSALAMSPAARFALEQGRDTVEAGASAGGAVRSGATMAALERLRMGMAAQDREAQLDRLSGVANMGLGAEGSMAGIRGDFADRFGAASQNRASALTNANNLRGQQTLGIRRTTADNLNAMRSATGAAIMDQRTNYGTGVGNALSLFSGAAGASANMQNNALGALGNAQAAGAIGFGNAINSGISNIQQSLLLRDLLQGQGGNTTTPGTGVW